MSKDIQQHWLTPKQVSIEYGFSISTLNKWRMSNGHIPFSKIGKYIKYHRDDIEAFINSHKVEVSA